MSRDVTIIVIIVDGGDADNDIAYDDDLTDFGDGPFSWGSIV